MATEDLIATKEKVKEMTDSRFFRFKLMKHSGASQIPPNSAQMLCKNEIWNQVTVLSIQRLLMETNSMNSTQQQNYYPEYLIISCV